MADDTRPREPIIHPRAKEVESAKTLLDVGIVIGTGAARIAYLNPRGEHADVDLVQGGFGKRYFPPGIAYDVRTDGWVELDSAWQIQRTSYGATYYVPSLAPYVDHPGQISVNGLATHSLSAPGETLTVPWLLTRILLRLSSRLHGLAPDLFRIEPVVIAAPFGLVDAWRAPLTEACFNARLELLDVISEPEAILTSYLHESVEGPPEPVCRPGEQALVLNWGADTLQFVVVRAVRTTAESHEFEVVAARNVVGMGGAAISELLGHCAIRHSTQPVANPLSAVQRFDLLAAAEEAKIALTNGLVGSDNPEHFVNVPTVVGYLQPCVTGADLLQVLTDRPRPGARSMQEQFEESCEIIKELTGGVDHILLAGGSSALPIVRPTLRRIFGAAPVWRVPDNRAHVEEAVVRGAALRAAQLQGKSIAGLPVHIRDSRDLKRDIGVTLRSGGDTTFVPLLRAGARAPMTHPTRHAVRVTGDHAGRVRLAFAAERAPRPYQRAAPSAETLARMTISPVSPDELIDVHLQLVDETYRSIVASVGWKGGQIGPAEIRLPD